MIYRVILLESVRDYNWQIIFLEAPNKLFKVLQINYLMKVKEVLFMLD